MSKEEKDKWTRIGKIIDALNENFKKFGYFEIWLKDNSKVIGSEFTITYYNDYTKEFYVVIQKNGIVCAKIRDSSIKYIGPEIFAFKDSEKNE